MTTETRDFILVVKKLHAAIVEHVLSNDILAEADGDKFNPDTSIATVIPVLAKYIAKSFGDANNPNNFEIARLFDFLAIEIEGLIDNPED